MSKRPTQPELLEWLQERFDNTQAIAAKKAGKDRDGWLNDGAYLKAAIQLVSAVPGLLEACKAALGVIDCEDMGYERNTDEIKMLRAAIAKVESK